MKILSIETSCDETGISLIEGIDTHVSILGNALASQIALHAQYGGVFPALAKRAHAEQFAPLLSECLSKASMLTEAPQSIDTMAIDTLCAKDTILGTSLTTFLSTHARPDIDYIAVTTGPGLEPALWVGITAAKVLSHIWNTPLIPINHMEGHVLVGLLQEIPDSEHTRYSLMSLQFPALALLVSGGHTELVLINDYSTYTKIGQTVDDAVGEAFDKVARILGIPYPGGPAVSALAAQYRINNTTNPIELPRPMIHSGDYNFSYSGLKTAVLYKVRDMTDAGARTLTDDEKMSLAAAFEDAAIEVLVKKTTRAVKEFHTSTLIVGGGVAANSYLRAQLNSVEVQPLSICFPQTWLATDNSVMIGIAAYVRALSGHPETLNIDQLKADGNLSITDGGYRK